ncbi:alkaline phosphatase family protein [Halovenus sp. HT40]|uniref:alkaline phosphatase family protein n=1 Tax=Halovenus sp. HT40 TaxID=3126691 RepID=UPI00300EECAC
MTVVVFGIDALDPDLVDPEEHPHLTLAAHAPIETINSVEGEPSTHELWPTIITGVRPDKHGLVLDDGVAWDSPVLRMGSKAGDYVLPDSVQTQLGALLLNQTDEDAFRTPASYYADNDLSTVFDDYDSKTIGIPNYVTDSDSEDREHQLRREMGELFERDPEAKGGHTSADPVAFYEQCLEMTMIRTARVRRALRGQQYELVFGYTSGLDLVGHVSYDRPALQERAYDELNDFVGELRGDLGEDDELVLVSDHGLQDGLHTETAMIAATDPDIIDGVASVLDVRQAIETELDSHDHTPEGREEDTELGDSSEVREQLEDLGYM